MQMVREQLERDPPPSLAALYGRAVRLNPEIRRLSPRQFNARYPLQVRRRMKRQRAKHRPSGDGRRDTRRKRKPERTASPELRARVRTILLQYAKAVAGARTTAELIDTLEEVDLYVNAVTVLLNE